MNRKAAGGLGFGTTIVSIGVIALVVVAVLLYGKISSPTATIVAPAAITQSGQVVTSAGVVSCPSDGTTDGQIRYQDMLASTNTYGNPTAYFVSKSGLERVTSGTLQTDGTFSTAVNLKCTEAGTRWQAIAVTGQDTFASAVGDEFVAEGSYTKVEIKGKAIDGLQVKIEDKFTGGAKYFNLTDASSNDQGWTSFSAAVGVNVSNLAADTGTSLALGVDGYIDARVYVKTQATKHVFGEDGLRVFALVDADGSQWSEPIIGRDAGAKLQNVITTLSDNDKRAYSGYEYAYEVGAIDDREHYLDFYLQSAAGVNPSTMKPILELCAEGRYNSVKSLDTIKIGCWTDAASQAEVSTADRSIIRFETS